MSEPGQILTSTGLAEGPLLKPGDCWTADLGRGIIISGRVPTESERRDSLPGESR